MGTWGTGVLDDDLASDVYDGYVAAADGQPPERVIADLRAAHAAELTDPAQDAVFWLAVAHAQRDLGAVQPEVRARVERIVAGGIGLEVWEEAGAAEAGRRRGVLTRFLASLDHPPSRRPKRARRTTAPAADFARGDCLSIALADGRFAAAVVTRDDRASTAPSHTLTFVDATGPEPPPQAAFDPPRWLILAPVEYPDKAPKFTVYADGLARYRKRYQVVSRVALGSVPEPLVLRQATWATLWRTAADVLFLTR